MARYNAGNTIEMGMSARVWLDGKEIDNVEFADTTVGKVRVACTNRDGLLFTGKHGKRVRTKTMRGRVEVTTMTGEPLKALIDHRYRHDSPFRRRQAIHSRRRWLAAWLRENRTVKKV